MTAIKLPTTVEDFKLALKLGIEAYSESPVKNKNKLNEATAIALNLNNQDTLSGLTTKSLIKSKYSARIEDSNDVYVNDILINDFVFEGEQSNYDVRTRSEIIEFITDHFHDVTEYNQAIMEVELKFLKSIDDEFVLKSIINNEIIASSTNPERFDSICEAILEFQAFNETSDGTTNFHSQV